MASSKTGSVFRASGFADMKIFFYSNVNPSDTQQMRLLSPLSKFVLASKIHSRNNWSSGTDTDIYGPTRLEYGMVIICSLALLSNIPNTDVDDLTMSCFTSDCWSRSKLNGPNNTIRPKKKLNPPKFQFVSYNRAVCTRYFDLGDM